MEIGAVNATLYLWVQINFYLCFLYLLSDVSEILYNRSEHNAVAICVKIGAVKTVLDIWA
jgi:hypothetical protein